MTTSHLLSRCLISALNLGLASKTVGSGGGLPA